MEAPPQPIGEPFSAWPEYVAEAKAVITAANERGLHLRLLGALAVIEQCPNGLWLLERTNRILTDLDFMGYDREIRDVEEMFQDMGYQVLGGRGVTMDVWIGRRIFHDPAGRRRRVDVFLDRLDFCHPIELKGRLQIEDVTIPLTDILLEKLQIVEINEKDLKDLVVLLLEHPVTDHGLSGSFDASYVVDLLSKDWGFFYTVSLNLDRLRRYMGTIEELSEEQRELISSRIDELWDRVDAAPKSMKWKLRARVGPSKKWYQEVGEGYRELGRESTAWDH
ncbi:MAG TPA: hypothetical protein VFZ75_08100 [Actinomycetota bacterium]|nr:hypothetical protein [Actinomycetota bacterium]